MKKIININFQGRVVPIEESAYEILKQYVESLRRYFANEEGRDEIINDIESRIAELFFERLKKGATCITDDDVNAVIGSIGRPEDFDPQDTDSTTGNNNQYQQTYSQSTQTGNTNANFGRGRLYRNADDKILGGVCSGLANYMGIDPVVMRIIFVVLFGALFWVYIVLWLIVPLQSIQSNITKRLFRSTDDKVIAGVCGGLAAYFNIANWIPRLIFSLPLILGIISGTFSAMWWNWDFDFGPRIVSNSLGWTLSIVYIVLWIAVPYAVTAAEKLEMKGERVDLNSIRDTVKEDLSSFKTKAEKFGSEVKDTATQFTKEFSQTASNSARSFAAETAPIARKTRNGIGYVIGILFKAFFLFIAGIVAVALFGVLISVIFGGFAAFPFKNFLLEGTWQNFLAWITVLFFLAVPLIALLTWLVRRIMGVRSGNHYLSYIFGTLWFIGIVAAVTLMGVFARNFKTKSGVEENINLVQPAVDKIYVDVTHNSTHYYGGDWFGIDWDSDWPIYGLNQDTLMLNTVRVNIVKSKDSLFHVYKVNFSRGNTPDQAKKLAERISFNINQQDSTLILPRGFAISKNEKFRNQQVMVVIEVPVGKKIELNKNVDSFEWFSVNFNRRRGWNIDDDRWDDNYWLERGKEYIMTPTGPERSNKYDEKELKNGRFKMKIDKDKVEIEGEINNNDDNRKEQYRYNSKDSLKVKPSNKNKTKGDEQKETDEPQADTREAKNSLRYQDFLTPLASISKIF